MDSSPRVVFMGTPEFAVPPLLALLRSGYDIVGVLTRPDSPAGRGQQMEESPVKEIARAENLSIHQPRTLREPAVLAELAALKPDLLVVAAYGLILPPAVLALPPRGCINIHGSLLPKHRGAAPIAAAILAGDAETGVSIMLMDAGVDSGPVLSRVAIPISDDDTTGTLTARLADLGAELLISTLPGWLEGRATPEPQPATGASYAPRIEKRDGRIRWGEPAALIARRVRAYRPWPSAYTTWHGQTLKVIRARVGGGTRDQGPGIRDQGLVVAGERDEAGVITGDGLLWLEEVQLAGKRVLPIETFLRGAPEFIGGKLD
jgi:methionyl-tRNA formyltransferase